MGRDGSGCQVITAKLYSFLSRAKRKTSHTIFQPPCCTSLAKHLATTARPLCLKTSVSSMTNKPKSSFVQFGAADIMLLEASTKQRHKMKQDPSDTMEQLETEINRLGQVGVSLEANNHSSFPTSSTFLEILTCHN